MSRGASRPESDEALLRRAMNAAYRHLTGRARTREEMEDRLREKNYPDPIVRRVIETLESDRTIDDRALARQWTRDRALRRGWGPSRLRFELERKGIAKEWIEEALGEFFTEWDEEALAMEHLARRLKGRAIGNVREERRWSSYLYRHGYSPEAIRTVLRKMGKGSDAMTE